MAAVTDVQRLQARVEELERWVYGSGGPRGSRKVSDLGSSALFLGAEQERSTSLVLGMDATAPVSSPAARPLK